VTHQVSYTARRRPCPRKRYRFRPAHPRRVHLPFTRATRLSRELRADGPGACRRRAGGSGDVGFQGLISGVIILAVLLIENELEGHVLQPLVVGRYVRLHPLVMVLAAGALLGGGVGALVAIPVKGVIYNAWGPLNGRPSAVLIESRKRSLLDKAWRSFARIARSATHRT
jgi:hypothetical protein